MSDKSRVYARPDAGCRVIIDEISPSAFDGHSRHASVSTVGGTGVTDEEAVRALIVRLRAIASTLEGMLAPGEGEPCEHRFCDADGRRAYLLCQNCGARDPFEPVDG